MTADTLLDYLNYDKWKGTNGYYAVKWCDLCDTATISCLEEKCNGSSCNGTGCIKCRPDFSKFNESKTCVKEYLTVEEQGLYDKFVQLKRHIIDSLLRGEKEIDWQKLDKEGRLSEYDCHLFLSETYGENPSNKRT
jgi:hypothetical protein